MQRCLIHEPVSWRRSTRLKRRNSRSSRGGCWSFCETESARLLFFSYFAAFLECSSPPSAAGTFDAAAPFGRSHNECDLPHLPVRASEGCRSNVQFLAKAGTV